MNFKKIALAILSTLSINTFAATYDTTAAYIDTDDMYRCGMNANNELVFPTDNGYTGMCAFDPSYFGVKMYNIKLCTALAGAPTTTTGVDFTNCVDVFENATGSLVESKEGESTPLVGTMSRPANGQYTHYYLEYDSSMRYKATVKFQNSRRGSGGNDGVHCSTKAGTQSVTDVSTSNSGSQCGSTENTNPGLYVFQQDSYDWENGTFDADDSDTDTLMWLLDSNGYLAANKGEVVRQTMAFKFATAVTVTDNTSEVQLSFPVKNALLVKKAGGVAVSGTGTVYFEQGPFDLQVTVR